MTLGDVSGWIIDLKGFLGIVEIGRRMMFSDESSVVLVVSASRGVT